MGGVIRSKGGSQVFCRRLEFGVIFDGLAKLLPQAFMFLWICREACTLVKVRLKVQRVMLPLCSHVTLELVTSHGTRVHCSRWIGDTPAVLHRVSHVLRVFWEASWTEGLGQGSERSGPLENWPFSLVRPAPAAWQGDHFIAAPSSHHATHPRAASSVSPLPPHSPPDFVSPT